MVKSGLLHWDDCITVILCILVSSTCYGSKPEVPAPTLSRPATFRSAHHKTHIGGAPRNPERLFRVRQQTKRWHNTKNIWLPCKKSGNSTAALHTYAVCLARKGYRRESLKILARLLRSFPSDDRIKSDYVTVLVWDNQYKKAVREFTTISRSFRKPAYLYRNVARAFYELGKFKRALFFYNKALAKDKNDHEAWKGVVLSLASLGKTEKAMKTIEKTESLLGSPYEVMLLRATVYEKNKRFLDAYRVYSEMFKRFPSHRESILRRKIRLFSTMTPGDMSNFLNSLLARIKSSPGCISRYCLDYILALSIARHYKEAVDFWVKSNLSEEDLMAEEVSWLAWSYFKTGNVKKAITLYKKALGKDPEVVGAHIGLAYCYAAQRKSDVAKKIIDDVLRKNPRDVEALFARAYVLEKEHRLWQAIRVYEKILSIYPRNRAALALKIRALSSLGLTTVAIRTAKSNGFEGTPLAQDLEGDLAARFIHWKGDLNKALSILEEELKTEPRNHRAMFDYIIALFKKAEMRKVIQQYRKLKNEKITVPYWVLRAVAGAYLYLEKPFTAIKIYRIALEQNPKDIETRMGLFYALQEVRRWEKAEKLLDSLDRDLAWIVVRDGIERENWNKYQVMLARGWLYLYEDRLEEAEKFFEKWMLKAPADTGTRTGLAFTHLWRGWPRKALEDFQVVLNLVPEKDTDAKRGLATALDSLARKREARRMANSLLKKSPKNKYNQELVRYFQVEDMRKLYSYVDTTVEDTGADDIWITLGAEQPLGLNSRVYVEGIWNRSTFENNEDYFRRIGFGLRHTINSTWAFDQKFSFDVSGMDNFGSFTSLTYTPDDYWTIGASFDSYSLAMPLRARVQGTEGNECKIVTTLRESELSEYTLRTDYFHYTDGNDSVSASIHTEHQIITRPDFKTRIYADISTTRNTKTDTPYFSPSEDFTVSLTHMFQWVRYKLYRKSLVDRLLLSIGGYKQAGYSWGPVGSIRYEQDIDFSDTTSLGWGTEVNRKIYDGDPVYAWKFDMLFNYKF